MFDNNQPDNNNFAMDDIDFNNLLTKLGINIQETKTTSKQIEQEHQQNTKNREINTWNLTNKQTDKLLKQVDNIKGETFELYIKGFIPLTLLLQDLKTGTNHQKINVQDAINLYNQEKDNVKQGQHKEINRFYRAIGITHKPLDPPEDLLFAAANVVFTGEYDILEVAARYNIALDLLDFTVALLGSRNCQERYYPELDPKLILGRFCLGFDPADLAVMYGVREPRIIEIALSNADYLVDRLLYDSVESALNFLRTITYTHQADIGLLEKSIGQHGVTAVFRKIMDYM